MNSNKNTARLAGFLYLIVVLTGIFSLLYVPSKLVVWDNPLATLKNIQDFNSLFRLSIVADSICFTAFLLLPLVLYKLLASVNKYYAITMVALAVPSVPILFINLFNKFAVLELLNNVNVALTDQTQNNVMFYLNQFYNGNLVGQNFWALWLFPLGWLIYRSGIIPKFFGIFLMLGSIGYYLDFLGKVIFSNYSEFALAEYMTIPASIGEIGTCLWLLTMGAKEYSKITSPQ